MHELAITQSVVELVAERTRGRRVVTVHVRVGLLSGVVPESLEFCFDLAVLGTPLDGARVEIERVPGRLLCRTCGEESAVPDLILLCPCGSADVEAIAGHELTVSRIELEREPTCA